MQNSFKSFSGAEVMCAETVPVRMHTASQQRQGPEATLVWSQPEPGVKVEDWLLFIRWEVTPKFYADILSSIAINNVSIARIMFKVK